MPEAPFLLSAVEAPQPDSAEVDSQFVASNRGTPGTTTFKRQLATRHRRSTLIAFVTDANSERALHEGLSDAIPSGVDVRRGGIGAAIASMRKATTPSILVVDVSDEDEPLTALAQLAEVVEPDVRVLVIGKADSVAFYREVTRNLGANDYIPKPLTNDKVARHLGTLVMEQEQDVESVKGGHLVIITGVRGGVGATTLAVNLAGHFGISMHRHTVLFDPDLYLGDAAFLLDVKPGQGLRVALESPERIDTLLAERAAQPAAERLHVLAGDEQLAAKLNYAPGAAVDLLAALRRRYSLIIADVPFSVRFRQAPLFEELLEQTHQRVLVMSPTLTSVRAALRFLSVPTLAKQARRPVIVLNRLGSAGGLTRRQVEDALAVRVNVVIPDLPRQIATAATMGELAMTSKGSFRTGILELARHVDFAGLHGATADIRPNEGEDAAPRGWRRLFRRNSS
jgi:pilus assembly protein CpaE